MSEISYASSAPRFADVAVGDSLPTVFKPAITRSTLALFAGASGDHNPVHIDTDFAQSAGLGDVFAQGMLIMAYLGQALTNWSPPSALRQFAVRFGAVTKVGDAISCNAVVREKFEANGEKLVRLDLSAADQHGEIKLQGEAVIALN